LNGLFRRWRLVRGTRQVSFPLLPLLLSSLSVNIFLSLSLLPLLATMRYKTLLYYTLLAMLFCFTTSFKAMEPADYGLKALKP
jgi:hypothetical protein